MRWRSRSMSSTLTLTVWPISRISDGWLTWSTTARRCGSGRRCRRGRRTRRSRRCSRSTPSTTAPGSSVVEDALAHLAPLLLEHRAARQHDVVARAVELDHACSAASGRGTPRDPARGGCRRARRAGSRARPRSMIRPPLTTSMTVPVDGLAALGGRLDASSTPSRTGRASSTGSGDPRRPPSVRTSASTSSPSATSSAGSTVAADRQLVERDDAFGLVPDVDEDLVLVDAHDQARDDVTLVEGGRSSRRSSGPACRRPRSRHPGSAAMISAFVCVDIGRVVSSFQRHAHGATPLSRRIVPSDAISGSACAVGIRAGSLSFGCEPVVADADCRPRAAGRAGTRRSSPRARSPRRAEVSHVGHLEQQFVVDLQHEARAAGPRRAGAGGCRPSRP